MYTFENPLHFTLYFLEQSLQLIHIWLLLWPADLQTLLLVGLWNDVEVDMANFLVCQFAVVLQNVVVLEALGLLQGRGDVLSFGHEVSLRSCLC